VNGSAFRTLKCVSCLVGSRQATEYAPDNSLSNIQSFLGQYDSDTEEDEKDSPDAPPTDLFSDPMAVDPEEPPAAAPGETLDVELCISLSKHIR
jgi:hypothetical protein